MIVINMLKINRTNNISESSNFHMLLKNYTWMMILWYVIVTVKKLSRLHFNLIYNFFFFQFKIVDNFTLDGKNII